MLLVSLATAALACDHVDIEAPGVEISVDDDCGEEAPPAPAVMVTDEDEVDDESGEDDGPVHDRSDEGLALQYGLQFLPDSPGHQISARLVGERDAYLGAELRYVPASDFAGVGRIAAGFDVLGGGNWDLTLGLFLGAGGEWERTDRAATLYAAPIVGTEIAFGIESRRLFGKYRWLAGLGGGPIDELLTENEISFGYKVTDEVHVLGQYLILSPGEAENASGVGLGVRVVL